MAAMQAPFPDLTDLRVSPPPYTQQWLPLPTIPDSLLCGSASRLQSFTLSDMAFPGLSKLLLSATHLVELKLIKIPHTEYISPKEIVALISTLSSLKTLHLQLHPPFFYYFFGWQRQSLVLPKRSILPALEALHYNGINEYLEDLVTRIDTPQLNELQIHLSSNQNNFDWSLLAQFINRSPTLMIRYEARLRFSIHSGVELLAQSGSINIGISSAKLDRKLSSVAQFCNSPLHLLSLVENLYIGHPFAHRYQESIGGIENARWLELLLPFTAVKNLYLYREFTLDIATALQELVGARITKILPNLQKIFVDLEPPSEPFQENIEKFVAARQLSDHPITISHWFSHPVLEL